MKQEETLSPLSKRVKVEENEATNDDADVDEDEYDVGIDFLSNYIPDGREEEPVSICGCTPAASSSTSSCAGSNRVPQCHQNNAIDKELPLPQVAPPSRSNSDSDGEEENVVLNQKQKLAIEAAINGENVFITGPGGTGKSYVMKKIIEHLKSIYRNKPDAFVVMAPTGIAATALDGQTVHSFAGCGVPQVVGDFKKCWDEKARKRWRQLKVMLIDEISMLSGEFLDNLSNVVSNIRNTKNKDPNQDPKEQILIEKSAVKNDLAIPFGGCIQLIFCGDFLQLPPIAKKIQDIKATLSFGKITLDQLHCDRGFAFQSNVWKNADLKVIQLDHIFRQDNKKFQNVLSEIRVGELSLENESILEECARPLPVQNGVKPTILYPRNVDVTKENNKELDELEGTEKSYVAVDQIHVDLNLPKGSVEKAVDKLANHSFFDDCIAERILRLKIGAQVMLIKNEIMFQGSRCLVNGSRGVVIGFTEGHNCYKTYNSCINGCVYGLVKETELHVHKSNKELLPVVQFRCGRIKVIEREIFELDLTGVGRCERYAMPLKLAWAITVHKSQGMSIDYVKADVTNVFTEAQTYVALSRVTDEKGLELKGFARRKIMVDKRALAYYENPKGLFPHWNDEWEYS